MASSSSQTSPRVSRLERRTPRAGPSSAAPTQVPPTQPQTMEIRLAAKRATTAVEKESSGLRATTSPTATAGAEKKAPKGRAAKGWRSSVLRICE